MDKIAVLIPCYNESATIAKVVKDYRAALPEAAIYVYDNNSTDGTDEIARAAGAVVRYERRQGKGNVIRTMFREIDAECYLMIDGDDTYPAEDARAMADGVLRDGYDMVIGDRLSSTYFTENKRPFHNSGNVLVRKLVNRFFGGHVTDIMTGYRAFSPLFVKSFPILSKGFEIETEMTIHALDKNFALTSIPVGYRDRPAGSESKLNTFSDGFKVLRTIARLYAVFQHHRRDTDGRGAALSVPSADGVSAHRARTAAPDVRGGVLYGAVLSAELHMRSDPRYAGQDAPAEF